MNPRGFKSTGPVPHPAQDAERIPAHWLFARLGKRVLRPGGMAMTRKMLRALTIQSTDDVVEFGPGLGATARLALAARPASFIGIEANRQAARVARGELVGTTRIIVRTADDTGFDSQTASVVYGEALLTLQRLAKKRATLREAHRVLCTGGRLGLHELAIVPDDIHRTQRELVARELKSVLRGGALPMTAGEWCKLVESLGFEVQTQHLAPVRFLEPRQLLADEGLLGTLRFAWNLSRDAAARARLLRVRSMLIRNVGSLASIVIVARKAGPGVPGV